MHTPFTWGVNDCCLFACDVMKACLVDQDPGKPFRGAYKDALGAAKAVKKIGKSKNLEAMVAKMMPKLGATEVHPNYAQRLAIVLGDMPGHGPSVGVCIGSTVAFVGENGLVFNPLTQCRRAWNF